MLGVGVGTLDSGLLERILFPHRVYVMGCLPNMCNTSVCSMLGWEDCISTLTFPPCISIVLCFYFYFYIFRWGDRVLGNQGTTPKWRSSSVAEVGPAGSNSILLSLSRFFLSTYLNYLKQPTLVGGICVWKILRDTDFRASSQAFKHTFFLMSLMLCGL